MSTDLTGRTSVVIDLKNVKTLDLNEVLDELGIDCSIKWTFGTGANQATILFHDKDSGDESTGKVVDVHDGSLKDAFGDVLTMDAIKLLFVKNTHATLSLEVLGGTTPIGICKDATDIIVIEPGGFLLWVCPTAAGIDVTTNCKLKFLAAAAGTVTFDYAILGLD